LHPGLANNVDLANANNFIVSKFLLTAGEDDGEGGEVPDDSDEESAQDAQQLGRVQHHFHTDDADPTAVRVTHDWLRKG